MATEKSPQFTSWADVTALWPSDAECARDIGIKPNHLGTLKTRGKIPSEYWPGMIAGAAERGIPGVTSDTLLALQTHLISTAAG